MSWVLSGGGLLLGLVYFLKSRKFKRIEHTFTIEPVEAQNHQVAIVTVRMISTGTEPIKADDFADDLVIEFRGSVSIATARIAKVAPENLRPVYRVHRNTIVVSPLLLNVGETIEFFVVSIGIPNDVRVASRITGVPSLGRVRVPGFPTGRRDILYRYTFVLGFLLTPATQLPRIVSDFASNQEGLPAFTTGLAASLLSVAVVALTVYEHRKSRRWRS